VYHYVPNLRFPLAERFDQKGRPIGYSISRFHTHTLLDGEIVLDTFPDGTEQPKFLVFDALAVDNKNLLERPLDRRLGVYHLRILLITQHFMQFILEPYKASLKEAPHLFAAVPFMYPFGFTDLVWKINLCRRDMVLT
jgi:mRNA guanylyltransferase